MKTLPLTTKDDKTAKLWEKSVKKNQDPYGFAVMEVVSKLGANLDAGMDCEAAEKDAIKDSGITGFMAGAMASLIAQLHPRGKEFRKYWNNQFGVDNDEGTVNPAILTIKEKA